MSFTMTSPFAAISGDQIEGLAASSPDGKIPEDDLVLEGFTGDSGSVYEIEDLDTLSALEKYCRSDMPTQRLVYAAGIGAAVSSLDPSAVSGTVVALLQELLGDVYADIRLTALQQTVAVARRLRSSGMTFQTNIERLWDLVQPLLLDADTEVQETAAAVLADLSHLVAWGNQVAASQKLVWAVQRCLKVPAEAMMEGATAALRLITEVVAPREGSPLCFSSIQDFATTTFRDLATSEKSAEVRQGAALLLPQFVRHMPPAVRVTFLPGLIKSLAQDSHWNVRAEVPQLLVNILSFTPNQQQQQQPIPNQSTAAFSIHGLTNPPEPWPGGSTSSSGSGGSQALAVAVSLQQAGMLPQALSQQWQQQQWTETAGVTSTAAAAAGDAAAAAGAAMIFDELSVQERQTISSHVRDTVDRLCRDFSHQVKVAALASLGSLLPLLPAADAAAAKPPLLNLFISTAKPAASMSGVRVPQQLCAPRLSGRLSRQQQQQRAKTQQQQQGDGRDQPNGKADSGPGCNHNALAVAAAAAGVPGAWDDEALADTVAAAVDHQHSSSSAAAAADVKQQRRSFHVGYPAGTAGSELPMICAFHIGKVARHIGPSFWPLLQPAYVTLAAAAVDGDADIAAALLLSFPDLAAALGPVATRSLLVPVVMGLLHSQLERLCPVLSVLLTDIMTALPPDLRICMLQLMPSLALQPDREVAGDWRARLSVAVQIPAVAALIAPAQVAYCLWPLLLTLAKDPVYAVRAAAAAQMGKVLLLLPEQEVPAQRCVSTSGNLSDQITSGGLSSSGDAMSVFAAAAAAAAAGKDSGEGGGCILAATAAAADAANAADHHHQQQQQLTSIESDIIYPNETTTDQPVQQQQQQQQQLPHHGDGSAEHLDDLAAAVGVDDDHHHGDHGGDGSNSQPSTFEQDGEGDGRGTQRPMFDRMRKSLSIGLQQLQDGLQQGGDILMGHKATQAAINHMDRKIQWLQQQQAGSMFKNIGQRLSAAAAGSSYTSATSSSGGSSSSSSSHEAALYSLGPLADRLDATLDMLYNTVDPCQYLPTPAWYELVTDLDVFCNAGSSTERQVFAAAAAGGVVASRQQQLSSASSSNALIPSEDATPADDAVLLNSCQNKQGLQVGLQHQQQQQQQGTMHLKQLLHQLQQLTEDPVPGVRSRVASIVTRLLAADIPASLDHHHQQQQQQDEEPSGCAAATAATDCCSAASSGDASSSSSSSSSSSDVSSGAGSPASSSDSSAHSTDIEGGSGPLTGSSVDTEASAAAAAAVGCTSGTSSTTPQDLDGNLDKCRGTGLVSQPPSSSAATGITTTYDNDHNNDSLSVVQPLRDMQLGFGDKGSEIAAGDLAAAAAATPNGGTDE